jgi:TolB-like protein/Flp pilus assembly protein TadD
LIIAFLATAVVILLADRFLLEKGPDTFFSAGQDSPVAREAENVSDPLSGDTEKSIAVLPFVNMSSDPEQEYFSDGLSEELLNRLAQNNNLRVAARTSAFQFKGQNLDVADIGRKLNVENVLEGSVRKSGNRLRITAQLISVGNGFHLWSETYERELTDVFAIQDEISSAIADALELRLSTSTGDESERPTSNLEAYNLYLQARFYLATRIEKNMLHAAELFQQAVTLDPAFSKAWSGMALTYSLLPAYGETVADIEGGEKTMQSARAAIELDPENAEAWIARGRMEGIVLWDWAASESSLQHAITLAPSDINVVNLYGDTRTALGDFARAEHFERRAVELDPLTAVQYGDLSVLMLIMNRKKEGLEYARTAASLAPDTGQRVGELITALTRVGEFDDARDQIEQADKNLQANPGLVASWWCLYYYERNDVPNLRQALAHYIELSNDDTAFVLRAYIAFFSAWLDGVEAALPWLEKAYQQREYFLTWPEAFYLPERVSRNSKWLEFWNKPGLRELMDIRRANGPYNEIGYWKERLQ